MAPGIAVEAFDGTTESNVGIVDDGAYRQCLISLFICLNQLSQGLGGIEETAAVWGDNVDSRMIDNQAISTGSFRLRCLPLYCDLERQGIGLVCDRQGLPEQPYGIRIRVLHPGEDKAVRRFQRVDRRHDHLRLRVDDRQRVLCLQRTSQQEGGG